MCPVRRFLELHHEIWATLRDEVERAYARTAGAAGAVGAAGAADVPKEAKA